MGDGKLRDKIKRRIPAEGKGCGDIPIVPSVKNPTSYNALKIYI
jgi:hypothetical protein